MDSLLSMKTLMVVTGTGLASLTLYMLLIKEYKNERKEDSERGTENKKDVELEAEGPKFDEMPTTSSDKVDSSEEFTPTSDGMPATSTMDGPSHMPNVRMLEEIGNQFYSVETHTIAEPTSQGAIEFVGKMFVIISSSTSVPLFDGFRSQVEKKVSSYILRSWGMSIFAVMTVVSVITSGLVYFLLNKGTKTKQNAKYHDAGAIFLCCVPCWVCIRSI